MRRPCWWLALLTVTGALAAAPGAAAQARFEDSVSGGGTAETFGAFRIDARSGPDGEQPSGQASFATEVGVTVEGPVTCLSVRGNVASFAVPLGRLFTAYFEVTDNAGLGIPDRVEGVLDLTDNADVCPPLTNVTTGTVLSGDISVVDASPAPTAKDQCKDGGWQRFGTVFKNQGACVSFVAKHRDPPAEAHERLP